MVYPEMVWEEKIMAANYIGWHLAAAVPGASKAVPGSVGVGTSGPHDKLKTY